MGFQARMSRQIPRLGLGDQPQQANLFDDEVCPLFVKAPISWNTLRNCQNRCGKSLDTWKRPTAACVILKEAQHWESRSAGTCYNEGRLDVNEPRTPTVLIVEYRAALNRPLHRGARHGTARQAGSCCLRHQLRPGNGGYAQVLTSCALRLPGRPRARYQRKAR
jgi:hypothetical protein